MLITCVSGTIATTYNGNRNGTDKIKIEENLRNRINDEFFIEVFDRMERKKNKNLVFLLYSRLQKNTIEIYILCSCIMYLYIYYSVLLAPFQLWLIWWITQFCETYTFDENSYIFLLRFLVLLSSFPSCFSFAIVFLIRSFGHMKGIKNVKNRKRKEKKNQNATNIQNYDLLNVKSIKSERVWHKFVFMSWNAFYFVFFFFFFFFTLVSSGFIFMNSSSQSLSSIFSFFFFFSKSKSISMHSRKRNQFTLEN